MFSRLRPRYDPEVFYAPSPDRTSRMGKKLVNYMENFRDSIRETNAEKVHSQRLLSSRPQDAGPMQNNRSSSEEPRRPVTESVVDPIELRDVEAVLSRPQRSYQTSNSRAQVKQGARFEDFDELVKHLRHMDLTITQLQMLIDREAELWNVQPDQVPRYLDTLRRVIEAYGNEAELDRTLSALPLDTVAVGGGDVDTVHERSVISQEWPSVMPDALQVSGGPVESLGRVSARTQYVQGSQVTAGSSRSGLQQDTGNKWQEHSQFDDPAWLEPLVASPDRFSGLHGAVNKQVVALPSQPDHFLLLPPVSGVLNDIKTTELARMGKGEVEVASSAAGALVEPPLDEACSSANHTSPDTEKERIEPKRMSVGAFKKKLARSLLNMTSCLKNSKHDIELASGLRIEGAVPDLMSPRGDEDGCFSKREGKRPKRQTIPGAIVSDHSLVKEEDIAAYTAINEQTQRDQDFEYYLSQAQGLRRVASIIQKYAVARSQAEKRRESQNVCTEVLEELRRVATATAKFLEVHEHSLLTECVCCGDQKNTITAFPPHPPTYSCDHLIRTCNVCMDRWLASEIAGKGCKSLRCPECWKEMDHQDVIRGASEATREEYDRRLLLMALSEEPKFAWCLAPACNFGQLNDQNANFMECAGCKYQQCLLHRIPWHKGETCESYDQRVEFVDESEAATNAMIDDVSALCPGDGCGWRIQKISGCDHITCKKCKFQFCYQCRADHKEIKRVGNTAHAKDCKFHSENLNVNWPFNVHL